VSLLAARTGMRGDRRTAEGGGWSGAMGETTARVRETRGERWSVEGE